MNLLRALAVTTFAVALSAQSLDGQERPHYRGFALGASLASVAAASGSQAADAKTMHLRPALVQSLEWRPSRYSAGSTPADSDTVRQIAFSFYNDQLSRMVIDYERQRTEGMTDGDMIEGISVLYGPALRVAAKDPNAAVFLSDTELGTTLARWGDAEYSAVLYRSPYASSFRLVVSSRKLDALATAADIEAARLDEREAPQREIARQKKAADDARAAAEKARTANKAAFKP